MINNIATLNEAEVGNYHYDYLTKIYHENIETKQAFYEFFDAHIRDKNTGSAYLYAVRSFFEWAEQIGVFKPQQVNELIVSKWVHDQLQVMPVTSVKQRLSGLKKLFDCLVFKNILSSNPISSVKTTRYSLHIGNAANEVRQLLDAIDDDIRDGRRDRVLIALMTYTFARIGTVRFSLISAILKLKHEDFYWEDDRLWVRLYEEDKKTHTLPCHDDLANLINNEFLNLVSYNRSKTPFVFVTIDRKAKTPSYCLLSRSDVYVMIKKRIKKAGIKTQICNHTSRAT